MEPGAACGVCSAVYLVASLGLTRSQPKPDFDSTTRNFFPPQ
jgi:hypothetical protein